MQREHQAELKTQPEYCGFDATVGVSHQAPKLKVYPPITVVSLKNTLQSKVYSYGIAQS